MASVAALEGLRSERFIRKYIHIVPSHFQRWAADQSHLLHPGESLERVDHASMQGRNLAVFVAGHVRVGINQQRVVRIDAKPGVHGTHQPAHGHNGRSDQYRANGNLHNEQDVPQIESSSSRGTLDPADADLIT